MTDDFSKKLARIDRAVATVERLVEGEGLEAARALVSAVLDVHKDALEELVRAMEGSDEGFVALACRPRIAWLLGLHGINPDPLEGRAREALRAARAVPGTAGRAEIVEVDGERVSVRVLGGSDDGRRVLARAVERAMAELAPEAELAIEGVGAEPREPELFPAERLVRHREGLEP
ncbi:MAG TPA: hypothetical protein VFZ53_10865 [Polyangiaceae bacterium]